MAFDMNNQDIMALIAQLGGSNDLVNPPLQDMPTNMQQGGGPQMDVNQGLPNMQDMQSMSGQMMPQQVPQPQLGQNYPDNFTGLGLGDTAPQIKQPDMNQALMSQILALANQGLGGF